MKNEIDIDELMSDTWLTVAMLRHGATVPDGKMLYQRCCAQVEKVREALKQADVDEASIEHISYAQCALLDETALNRKSENKAGDDDAAGALREWRAAPLQARFFSSLRAGEALWDRIAEALRQPAPSPAVLTCYHRVLSLGFQGVYGTGGANPALREEALKALNARVAPLDLDISLLAHHRRARRYSLLRAWWFWAGLALAIVGLAWWGGHLWLQALIAAQLPEPHV